MIIKNKYFKQKTAFVKAPVKIQAFRKVICFCLIKAKNRSGIFTFQNRFDCNQGYLILQRILNTFYKSVFSIDYKFLSINCFLFSFNNDFFFQYTHHLHISLSLIFLFGLNFKSFSCMSYFY